MNHWLCLGKSLRLTSNTVDTSGIMSTSSPQLLIMNHWLCIEGQSLTVSGTSPCPHNLWKWIIACSVPLLSYPTENESLSRGSVNVPATSSILKMNPWKVWNLGKCQSSVSGIVSTSLPQVFLVNHWVSQISVLVPRSIHNESLSVSGFCQLLRTSTDGVIDCPGFCSRPYQHC